MLNHQPTPLPAREARPYYEIVRDELRRHIAGGALPRGVVLLEGPIANLLGVSRGPVTRALKLLEQERLVHRFDGRGYLVGPPDLRQTPKRIDLRTLDLDVSVDIQTDALRASWQRIYGEVADGIVTCMPYGAYQVSEAAMCQHFGVSRTVVRDVLGRLNHDGLIEKDRWSHWTAGPLTARDVSEHFEMRRILETRALMLAAGDLDRGTLIDMAERIEIARGAGPAVDQGQLEAIERDLHQTCVSRVANRRLVETIRRSRLPDVINRLFASQVGALDARDLLDEHRAVFDRLLGGAPQDAASRLESHLEAEGVRTRARLKVLGVFPDPVVAPYLARLVDGQSTGAPPPRPRPAQKARASHRPLTLRVLGRREILLKPIRQQAASDLGFDIEFDVVGDRGEVQRAATRPDSFDVYHQWHTVDVLWTARSIQPIDVARIPAWTEIAALAELTRGGRRVCDDLFRQLYVQADRQLGPEPSARAAMLPTIFGVDSPGYLREARAEIPDDQPDSWGWLLDERWRGRVAMLRDPTLGMIEAALAAEACGLMRFKDIANLSIEEIDQVVGILKDKKRAGHFRGLWETYEDAVRLMDRGGVVVQSIFSPAVTQLRRRGIDVVCSVPREGYRGWHSDLCISSATAGAALDAAYAYLNWWMEGPAGAILARQGYYMAVTERTRRHLSESEWAYWYEGEPAAGELSDPFGNICVHAGDRREGGSYIDRMSRVRVWNNVMDDHNYLARRWNEFLAA